jgi:hypothetical protein
LWRTNPKQQAGYLAVKFWARFYTPDVLLGAYTPDELHDHGERDITPSKDIQEDVKKGSVLDKLQSVNKKQVDDIELVDYEADEILENISTEAYNYHIAMINQSDTVSQLSEIESRVTDSQELNDGDSMTLVDIIQHKTQLIKESQQ